MKYGIIVGGKVTEPVTIPPSCEAAPATWLAKQFPTLSGWVLVSDDAVPGATYNGSGSSTNPSELPPPPKVLDWAAFNSYLAGLLDADPDIARAKLQDILEKCRDKTGTTDTDKLTRYFYTWFLGQTSFTKAETVARLAPVSTTAISGGQKTAVKDNWP